MKHNKILVAEDEKALSHALQLKLAKAGLEADVVSNGEEALKAINSGDYKLVLLDLMMPKLNGFTVMEKAAESGAKLPVILVMTNLSQDEDIKKAKKLGAAAYIIKSETMVAEIVRQVQSYIT